MLDLCMFRLTPWGESVQGEGGCFLRKLWLLLKRRGTPGLHRRQIISPTVWHFPLNKELILQSLGPGAWGIINVPWVMLRLKLLPLW